MPDCLLTTRAVRRHLHACMPSLHTPLPTPRTVVARLVRRRAYTGQGFIPRAPRDDVIPAPHGREEGPTHGTSDGVFQAGRLHLRCPKTPWV